MRRTLVFFTVLASCGLISLVAASWVATVYGQSAPKRLGGGQAGDLIVIPQATGAGQRVFVIDTRDRVMGVYDIGDRTGEIQLRSVRNFRWDFMLDEFNGTAPKPKDVRAMLDVP